MTENEAINVMEKYTDITLSKVVIEAHNMAISALEKQIPKKPTKTFDGNLACGCGMIICNKNRLLGLYYCHRCGQRFEIGANERR